MRLRFHKPLCSWNVQQLLPSMEESTEEGERGKGRDSRQWLMEWLNINNRSSQMMDQKRASERRRKQETMMEWKEVWRRRKRKNGQPD